MCSQRGPATVGSSEHLPDSLERLGHPGILVLGDLILDRYTWGHTQRISPEAPVLILDADTREARPGGAASVAYLARRLDASVAIAGVLGEDDDAAAVRGLLGDAGIDLSCVLHDAKRPTTVKERFIGRAATRHAHQILRVDRELRDPIDTERERRLTDAILPRLDGAGALLVSDYAKGVCTPALLQTLFDVAARLGVPVIVDPARIPDYDRYRGATILTPNRVEAESAAGRAIETPDDAIAAGAALCRQCRSKAALVTLDRQGIAIARPDGTGELVPTRPRTVYDVTGAGDMVLAVAGLGCAAGLPLAETVRLANLAAGLEVERIGVAPLSRSDFRAELRRADADDGVLSGTQV